MSRIRVRSCNPANWADTSASWHDPLRFQFAGAVYHLTSRGNARQKIFFNDAERLMIEA